MVTSDSYLPQYIKSELDKLDVLLNAIHVTKYIPNLWDLELKALFQLKCCMEKADKGSAKVISYKDDYITETHN